MKAEIHPQYFNATVTCSCGNVFQTGATKPAMRVEVCGRCHPFYTGASSASSTRRDASSGSAAGSTWSG